MQSGYSGYTYPVVVATCPIRPVDLTGSSADLNISTGAVRT